MKFLVSVLLFFVFGLAYIGVRVGEASTPGPLTSEQRSRVHVLTESLGLDVPVGEVDSFVHSLIVPQLGRDSAMMSTVAANGSQLQAIGVGGVASGSDSFRASLLTRGGETPTVADGDATHLSGEDGQGRSCRRAFSSDLPAAGSSVGYEQTRPDMAAAMFELSPTQYVTPAGRPRSFAPGQASGAAPTQLEDSAEIGSARRHLRATGVRDISYSPERLPLEHVLSRERTPSMVSDGFATPREFLASEQRAPRRSRSVRSSQGPPPADGSAPPRARGRGRGRGGRGGRGQGSASSLPSLAAPAVVPVGADAIPWHILDAISVVTEFRKSVPTMAEVPDSFRGSIRAVFHLVLKTICDSHGLDAAKELQAWKMLLLIPRLLLRPTSSSPSTSHREELRDRIARFWSGNWQSLIEECVAVQFKPGSSRNQGGVASMMISKGQLSKAASLLTSHGVAPLDATTKGELSDPEKRPPNAYEPLPVYAPGPPVVLDCEQIKQNIRDIKNIWDI